MKRSRAILVGIGVAGLVAVTLVWANRYWSSSEPREWCWDRGRCAEVALALPAFAWDSTPATAATLYTNRGSYGAERKAQYREELNAAIPSVLATMGERAYPHHLRVFVVSSRDEVESITGTVGLGWADPLGMNTGVVARAECRPVFRHEIMHTVSLLLWGHPATRGNRSMRVEPAVFESGGWLREGIANAVENRYATYSIRGMVAQYQAEGALLPLDSLTGAFYRYTKREGNIAVNLQSGAFVSYLIEQYGAAPFRQVWREGTSAFQTAYGKSGADLESEWHRWVRATPTSERPKSIAIALDENVCPKPRR